MEVVAAVPPPPNGALGGPPFHNHDVREWSRLNSITGVLERARFETDHWTANTSSSSHAYGKVVDSRTRSDADGALQQRARRQLEVFESSVPGGRLQVIKSHTVSSSRWTSSTGKSSSAGVVAATTGRTSGERSTSDGNHLFGDLNLSLNPLDVTSQKSRASVGRSVGRRPPSRPRLRDETQQLPSSSCSSSASPSRENRSSNESSAASTASPRVHRIARLCNQHQEDNVVRHAKPQPKPTGNNHPTISTNERLTLNKNRTTKTNLCRTKSTSSEDVLLCPQEETGQDLDTWRRTSKIRRSLQFPSPSKTTTKPDDLPANTGNVRKIKEDLETGRRLSTALRGNSFLDLQALDNILQSLSSGSDQNSVSSDKDENHLISFKKQKRNSFVTVESLKEVKERLRRTTSSPNGESMGVKRRDEEDIDDGIVTEDSNKQSSRVRSYVYGLEKISGGRKQFVGTGSLETRSSKQTNGNMSFRDEDWYNRRKSYGFEQVHNHHQEPINATSKTIESSTDSGICRSGEILQDLTTKAGLFGKPLAKISDFYCDNERKDSSQNVVKRYTSLFEKRAENTNGFDNGTVTIPVGYQNGETNSDGVALNHNSWGNGEIKRHSIAVDESKYVSKSVVNSNYRRTSLAVNGSEPLEDELLFPRKPKRVEFCKTEVHFAADSGRVNIVATDDKPPPTNNFRRRRRNSGGILYDQLLTEANKNGLPVLHFGDSPDKDNFSTENHENVESFGVVTVSTNNSSSSNGTFYDLEEVPQRDNSAVAEEAPRGILKNKPVKPRPYLLGDDNFFSKDIANDEDCREDNNKIWGVKLKPVAGGTMGCQNKQQQQQQETAPMWKSTVTLKNTLFERQKNKSEQNYNGYRNDRNNGGSSAVIEESKGFSTKVNIGGGEASVILDDAEDRRTNAWPRFNEPVKDARRHVLNKALIVRIGKDDDKSDKVEKDCNTTTTKITIDLSPSPTNNNSNSKMSGFEFSKTSSPFKSTSLILNTIKSEMCTSRVKLPEQLDVLRRLYEDCHSDAEADREVQSLMNGNCSAEESSKLSDKDDDDDNGASVLSGSWSKMKAYRNMHHHKTITSTTNPSSHAHAQVVKKDFSNLHINNSDKNGNSPRNWTSSRVPHSPVVLRKLVQNGSKKTEELRAAVTGAKLSSPFLVVQNAERVSISPTNVPNYAHPSPVKTTTEIEQVKRSSPSLNRQVLRTPKRSEMAYFGVQTTPSPKISPKPPRKVVVSMPTVTTKESSPIYENVRKTKPKEFDSSVLDELTKAADEILEAVNELSMDSGSSSRQQKKSSEKLETITESKSWNSRTRHKACTETSGTPSRTHRRTASTSSVDSGLNETRKAAVKASEPVEVVRYRKKSSGDGASSSSSRAAATKARRLQRASSREALLQSHGSSSEDLPVTTDSQLRKPRLVRKTKTPSSYQNYHYQYDTKQRSVIYNNDRKGNVAEEKRKSEERIGALPEIRHKTAVSTIRSTAEKSLNRERLQGLKAEEAKKKYKKDPPKSSSTPKGEKVRSVPGKDSINHRIATANIKKCSRYERSARL